jgi:hypothetical protein
MKQAFDPSKNYDITGEVINEGDWLVIPASGGGMTPIRWGKVVGMTPQGWPKVQTFQTSYGHWVQSPDRPTTLMIPAKTWLIAQSTLPKGLIELIDTAFGGDVGIAPKTKKRSKKVA